MPLKALPYYKDWPALCRAHRITNDDGFGKILEAFWQLGRDQHDERLAQLPKVQRAARALARSKSIANAEPTAPKMLEEIARLCDAMRREVLAEKKIFAANGAHPVDVQFIVVDWNGMPLRNAIGRVIFKSPGVPAVARKEKLSSGSLDINDARLRSTGTVHLHVQTENNGDIILGATDYAFKPGAAKVIKFKAVQHAEQLRARAKSIDEVSRKLGVKGSVGADWKVVKIGGEVVGERVDRGALEEEVEWHVKKGLPSFLEFRQL